MIILIKERIILANINNSPFLFFWEICRSINI